MHRRRFSYGKRPVTNVGLGCIGWTNRKDDLERISSGAGVNKFAT